MAIGIKSILRIRNYVPLTLRLQMFDALLVSHLKYAAVLLGGIPVSSLKRLDRQLN